MRLSNCISALALVLCFAVVGSAAEITFDDLISGQISYGYDGDGDSQLDVVFTTDDPLGFNSTGPGANQNYIHEPGIEGTTALSPDLRVNFLNGASGSIAFGFALVGPGSTLFELFDSSDNLLGSTLVEAMQTPTSSGYSSFPEGWVNLNFSGVASYGLFDFIISAEGPEPADQVAGRYIIDDFSGTFGSTEDIGGEVPEPATVALFGMGLVAIAAARRFSRS